jgi:DNA-directed RNA polymerase sigma subunit (sigma70/sigma32)
LRNRKPKPLTQEEYEEQQDKLWIEQMKQMGGMSAQDGMTLEQVGAVLGCTRERVRQIEKSALRKLRRALIKRGILTYSDISAETEGTTNPFTED